MTELAGDALHLTAEPRYLGETELMHLGRRTLRRRVEPHQIGVPDIAGRQLGPARTGTRVRQILLLQVVVQTPVRRQNLLAQHARVVVGKPAAVADREARGKIQDRPPEHALARILDTDIRQLRQDRLDDDFRQHDALVDAETQVLDHVIGPGHEPVHAREKMVVVGQRRKWLCAGPRTELRETRREIRELVDRQQLARIAIAFDRHLAPVLEAVVRHAIVGVEPPADRPRAVPPARPAPLPANPPSTSGSRSPRTRRRGGGRPARSPRAG